MPQIPIFGPGKAVNFSLVDSSVLPLDLTLNPQSPRLRRSASAEFSVYGNSPYHSATRFAASLPLGSVGRPAFPNPSRRLPEVLEGPKSGWSRVAGNTTGTRKLVVFSVCNPQRVCGWAFRPCGMFSSNFRSSWPFRDPVCSQSARKETLHCDGARIIYSASK